MPVASVEKFQSTIESLLAIAKTVKATATVEPALTAIDFKGELDSVGHDTRQYAAIETACRSIFQNAVISTSINQPDFVKVWNLLDIISLLGDKEQCDPALNLWLVEELLDCQTIEGCRVVFDYLESRRERFIQKHFEKRKLIILRSCNELLRRLSRAEDTVFCGRVFIFLFQTFPLGDKSSVNLRGEYHVENKTTWDTTLQSGEPKGEEMEVDQDSSTEKSKNTLMPVQTEAQAKISSRRGTPVPDFPDKPGSRAGQRGKSAEPSKHVKPTMDLDTLYPIFWSLQEYFSEPTRLFDPSNFAAFKEGLEATIAKFIEAQKKESGRGSSRHMNDAHGVKRKRTEYGDELHGYNPKYLTSRDLFGLEISDLAFRRHVMVQSLILVDFLLSLTPEAKAKNDDIKTPNNSILYNNELGTEDKAWATETKKSLVSQLRLEAEGAFYYRMVDTVLSRDKNWVRWKAEGCPPMNRPAISADEWQGALSGATRIAANKKLQTVPLGALNFSFLEDSSISDLNVLKDPERYKVPKVEDFERPIADDEFNIEMTNDPEEKENLINARQSKIWRALRLASADRLKLFDKIDEKTLDLKPLFRPAEEAEAQATVSEDIDKEQESDKLGNSAKDSDAAMSDAPAITVQSPAPEGSKTAEEEAVAE